MAEGGNGNGTNHTGNPAWVRGGPSPNPTGPVSAAALRKFLSQPLESKDGKTSAQRREVLHAAIFRIAIGAGPNQLKAIELLLAYDSGRPVQAVEHSGRGGTAIPLDLSFLGEENLQKMREQMQTVQLQKAMAGDTEDGAN